MSRPFFAFCTLLILAYPSIALHGQNLHACPEGVAVHCGVDANMVTESPKALQLRANSTIVLSAPPVSSSDIRIFVNGMILIPGKDFNVNGKTVTFLRDLENDASGIVQIKYQSQFASAMPRETHRDIDVDRIASDALIRSVNSENTSGASLVRTRAHIARTSASSGSQEGRTELPSLRLLVRNLNGWQDQYSDKHHAVGASRGTLQGVEGTGDTSSTNNYAQILGVSSSGSADRLIHSRGVDAVGDFRSLRMLQQQLDRTGAR